MSWDDVGKLSLNLCGLVRLASCPSQSPSSQSPAFCQAFLACSPPARRGSLDCNKGCSSFLASFLFLPSQFLLLCQLVATAWVAGHAGSNQIASSGTDPNPIELLMQLGTHGPKHMTECRIECQTESQNRCQNECQN